MIADHRRHTSCLSSLGVVHHFKRAPKKERRQKEHGKERRKERAKRPLLAPPNTTRGTHETRGARGEGVSLHRSFFLTLTSMYNTANSLEFRSSSRSFDLWPLAFGLSYGLWIWCYLDLDDSNLGYENVVGAASGESRGVHVHAYACCVLLDSVLRCAFDSRSPLKAIAKGPSARAALFCGWWEYKLD